MRNSQTSTSKIPPHMVAWLSAEGWTAEELSFVETYGIKYKIDGYPREDVQKIMKIHARQEAQKGERAREYDSKNNYQRKDSPEWFRASIDRDLFK
ncbi:Uncharacterised protein [Streptococcus pneumoniae]|nr:Uncharacterised protein [Streptococcus pneumoniae]